MFIKHLVVLLLPAAAHAFVVVPSVATLPKPLFLSSVEAPTEERFTIFVGNLPSGKINKETRNKEMLPSISRSHGCVLFLFTLIDSTQEGLEALFSQHGSVNSVNVPTNRETGQVRGFAFVDMSSAESMQAAIDALNGEDFHGNELRVSESVPKDQLKKKTDNKNKGVMEGYKKLYVGNLPYDIDRDELSEFFSAYGDLQDIYIPTNADTGSGRGFAFLTLKEEDANRAVSDANGKEFNGRPLVVNEPLQAGERPARSSRNNNNNSNNVKLYVGNLSFYTVRETLQEIFEEFGTVIDCYMPEDPETGGTRGFGFVTMSKDAADRAVAEIDGCEVDGRAIRVNVAQPKGRGRN
jgi:RNA recognition motif-containing protein